MSRSVYGFEVRSPYPLRLLRQGGGGDTLDVVPSVGPPPEPEGPAVFEWALVDGERESRATLYRYDHAFQFRTMRGISCLVEPHAGAIRIIDPGWAFWEPGLWGVPALLCFAHRGDFSLHAAAVEVNGGAVLLGAPGRRGKTTLALAFHQAGYRVLSEDLACCRITPEPVIFPGPALMRLRPDMFDGTAPAGTHVLLERTDRIYLAVDEERRGSGAPVPIRGLVLLRESPGEVRAERIAGARALPDLWALSFRLPAPLGPDRCFSQLSGLVNRVPVWNLYRPLRRASLDATVASIVDVCGH